MADEKVKVMVCDDSAEICEVYQVFINERDDMECVGTAGSAQECIEVIEKIKPDLLLLDIQMEDERAGIKILPALKEKAPHMVILMLTGCENAKYVFQSVMNGADGYILKIMDGFKMFDEVYEAYHSTRNKVGTFDATEAFKREAMSVYDSLHVMQGVMNDMVKLSASEYEILREIYKGKTYKRIAKERVTEECTVKTIASRIIKKLGMTSMKELIGLLRELCIFDMPE